MQCDWGRTHIAVERKHTEWRDHHTKQMWHQRATLTYPRFRTRCTERTWHGRSRLTGTPQGWALMISPRSAYAGATAGMGVAAGVGRQACRQARSQGGESVPVSGGERAGQVGGGTAGAGAAGAVGAGAVMAG